MPNAISVEYLDSILGEKNGIATLNNNGKVPCTQIDKTCIYGDSGISDLGAFYITLMNDDETPIPKGALVVFDGTVPYGIKLNASGTPSYSRIGIAIDDSVHEQTVQIALLGIVDILIDTNTSSFNSGVGLNPSATTPYAFVSTGSTIGVAIALEPYTTGTGGTIKAIMTKFNI